MRERLKIPLGDLIAEEDVISEVLKLRIAQIHPSIVASVGDRTTERLSDLGLFANLQIVDFVEKRKPRKLVQWLGRPDRILVAKNPPGEITLDALAKLKRAFEMITNSLEDPVRLEVVGEEDLLALPVLAFFPKTVVFYGQPNEGLVIANSETTRPKARAYLAEIGIKSLEPNTK